MLCKEGESYKEKMIEEGKDITIFINGWRNY